MERPCRACGGTCTQSPEAHEFTESGLSNVLLLGARWDCEACREVWITIPRPGALLSRIARDILSQAESMAPEELRFVRAHVGVSLDEMAEAIGIGRDELEAWEDRGGAGRPRTYRVA